MSAIGETKPRRVPEWLSVYLGPGAVLVYVTFALLAYARYPAAYSPANNNWLSDLGNRNLNPSGANFYVAGCIVTGVLVLGFFLGLTSWRSTGRQVQNRLLLFVQLAGGIGAASLVMSAIFTEDQFGPHQFWSRMINAGFAVVLFMSPFAFRRPGRRSLPLIMVAVLGYCSIVAELIYEQAQWLEWPAIGLLLAYVCLLAWMTHVENAQVQDRDAAAGRTGPHPSRFVGVAGGGGSSATS